MAFNYLWTQLTNELLTNLYLYGQETKPDDLVNDQWLRPADDNTTQSDNIHITVDIAGSFITQGPGRFALAALSPLIQAFFDFGGGAIKPGTGTVLPNGGLSFTAKELHEALVNTPGGASENDGLPRPVFYHGSFTVTQSDYIDLAGC